MSDKLLLENYLLVLKSTVEVYVHGTLESSNPDIKKILKDSLNKTITHQENTYNLMQENNWYTTNNVNSKCINETIKSIESNS